MWSLGIPRSKVTFDVRHYLGSHHHVSWLSIASNTVGAALGQKIGLLTTFRTSCKHGYKLFLKEKTGCCCCY